MDDIKGKKREIRNTILKKIDGLSKKEFSEKSKNLETRLFEFANFIESNIIFLYMSRNGEFNMKNIVQKCLDLNKIVALPSFDTVKFETKLMKVDNLGKDIKTGSRGMLEPDPIRCKEMPVDCLDIAVIPGVAFDEKGGRIGSGEGYYDRLVSRLSPTTRKISVVFENQIVPQVPMESHDRHVDIIITDKRIIYKI